MSSFDLLVRALSTELSRAITGKLFTEDQIRLVADHAVGKYFADWLPRPEHERAARERVEEAREHITKASSIISAMQVELASQTNELDKVLAEIDEKKQLAERYAHLAATNEEQFAAFRQQLEQSLRQELAAHSEKGKTLRRLVSLFLWLLTLVLGAALGAYFDDVIDWIKGIAS